MSEEINISAFLTLITGLKYDDFLDEYTFNNEKYILKSVTKDKQHKIYSFMNINEPTDVKDVTAVGGIPTHDGFNNIKIDTKLRKAVYQKEYYKNKRYPNRREMIEKNKAEREKLRAEKKAELQKKKQESKYAPIKCAYCGVEFVPYAKNQKFHTDECRQRYYSEKQAKEETEKRHSEKTCIICGSKFLGTPREKYCSSECYKVAHKELCKERHKRDKISRKSQDTFPKKT